MRQLAVQRAFLGQAREPAMNADSQGIALNQLLLLAIERALAPPIVTGAALFSQCESLS